MEWTKNFSKAAQPNFVDIPILTTIQTTTNASTTELSATLATTSVASIPEPISVVNMVKNYSVVDSLNVSDIENVVSPKAVLAHMSEVLSKPIPEMIKPIPEMITTPIPKVLITPLADVNNSDEKSR